MIPVNFDILQIQITENEIPENYCVTSKFDKVVKCNTKTSLPIET